MPDAMLYVLLLLLRRLYNMSGKVYDSVRTGHKAPLQFRSLGCWDSGILSFGAVMDY